MLTVVTSGKASPGISTTAWALALTWPRPVLLVDADPAGGDLASGLLAGRGQVERGLVTWIAQNRRTAAIPAAHAVMSHIVSIPEALNVWLMPGLQRSGQAAALSGPVWDRLALALERAGPALGRDVIVDTGRIGPATCWPILRAADRVLVGVRPSVRSVRAAQDAITHIRSEVGDLDRTQALMVGSGDYTAKEVAAALTVPLAAVMPEDRAAAQVLSDAGRGGVRGVARSKLLRAARSLADALVSQSPAPTFTPRADAPVGGRP